MWSTCVCKHEVFELSEGLHLTFLRNSLSCFGAVTIKWDKETKDCRMSWALSIKKFTVCPKRFSGHGYENEAPQFVV